MKSMTIPLDWVTDYLYPESNYSDLVEKILHMFPPSQLHVVNGDNLIKFVFNHFLRIISIKPFYMPSSPVEAQ